MKVARASEQSFVPASHENPLDPGCLKKVLFAKGDICKGSVQMVNWACMPKGKSFQLHYHEDMDEVFVIVSGKVEMMVNDERSVLNPGDGVVVKARQHHRMNNIGDTDVQYIVFGVSTEQGGATRVVEGVRP